MDRITILETRIADLEAQVLQLRKLVAAPAMTYEFLFMLNLSKMGFTPIADIYNGLQARGCNLTIKCLGKELKKHGYTPATKKIGDKQYRGFNVTLK